MLMRQFFTDLGGSMYIIAGLGNPGRQYAGTRHNMGFNVVTRIADDYKMQITIKEHKALCAKGFVGGQKVLLALPQTYMNLSGESIKELINYYKVDPATELMVIYDDVSMDVGRIRMRAKGSAGGHNGIKNIIAELGTDVFPRMKVGVGEKPKGWDLADYVLGRFSDEENEVMRRMLARGSDACRDFILYGIQEAMNRYNN